ncbi:ATP-binding protein [Pseudomonas gingeri]|uniref:ATP-binding protein n=1 Tax=Pseudomonas gingeri TaxID=117681 RepID=UPI0015A14749|nr:ATP-binding protein [Pseudomonas gingeri]NWD73742.1 ATP-binding protein [Pseudomonas gingeri]
MVRESIQQKITDLAEQFEQTSQGLVSVTKPLSTFEFENGVYGVLFVKPNKRLAKIFSTDREVIVLITNFQDQQQRTIQALKLQIFEYNGRLEGSLAIVVHADPEGDRKLKNWGREQGLAILPISAHDNMSDPATFERDLLQDFFTNDPFDVTGPVSDDARFFGRRTEALDIARQLRNGQIRSSLGIRKIGKTSILNRILHEARTHQDCVCVMVDCSKDDVWEQEAIELLNSIAESITAAAISNPRYAEVLRTRNRKATLSDARSSLLNAIQKTDGTVIIFFDEVDYITPGSPTAKETWTENFNPFWRNLRVVVQECARLEKKLSLLVCGVSSKWFKEESINGVENAVLAFIPEEYLSPLASTASAAMIRATSKVAGLSFDDATAEWIGNACGNMPYWTRKACSYIHRHIDVRERPCTVQKETVDRLVKDFVEVEGAAIAEVALNHLFRVHPEVYRPAKSLLEGQSLHKSDPLTSTLLRYGVFRDDHGSIRLGSMMIVEGLKLYEQKRTTSTEAAGETELPASSSLKLTLDEWADELALINASRNILERKLRGLALNFIKFSCLQDKSKGSPSERIQKCIEKARVDKLKHLPPDDLIEKLLWSELVRLVEKEWTLFSPIFNDLRLLKEHALVVNDRPDTHAKDVDGADIAHYRRSLRWLEDAVQRASS